MLSLLIEKRQKFVKILVEVTNPSSYIDEVMAALKNLVKGKKAFGFFSFGNKEVKKISTLIDAIKAKETKKRQG